MDMDILSREPSEIGDMGNWGNTDPQEQEYEEEEDQDDEADVDSGEMSESPEEDEPQPFAFQEEPQPLILEFEEEAEPLIFEEEEEPEPFTVTFEEDDEGEEGLEVVESKIAPSSMFRQSSSTAEMRHSKSRSHKSLRHGEGDAEAGDLLSLRSDSTGPAPEIAALPKECENKGFQNFMTTEESLRAKALEEDEFFISGLHAVDSLAPFSLKRVYGRLDSLPIINLTGTYNNHIVYASSNLVVVYDYVQNVQKCLQGHRNSITSLQMDPKGHFLVTTGAGKSSLIIVWDAATTKALTYFTASHNGTGSVFACFTGLDYIFASLGAEEAGKQSISFWNYDPKEPTKEPLLTETLPKATTLMREIVFLEGRSEYFVATGERGMVFGTWTRDPKPDTVYCHKPRLRKTFIDKYKKFTSSLWMNKEGTSVATATGSGMVLIWGPPVILGLEEPPDKTKNIKEFQRSFRLCDDGIVVFKTFREFVVIGDEQGIVRFFNYEFKLLRWTKSFSLPAIKSISFNQTEDAPTFKRKLRQMYSQGLSKYPERDENNKVKDYTFGGAKLRQASTATLEKAPMTCPDFIIGVGGGDIYYYHFHEGQIDRIVPGTPGDFVTCDACPGSNHVAFVTKRGHVQMYDFITHDLIFSDRIFAGSAQITTMKFHPIGQLCAFGLSEGRVSFRWNYTWKTAMAPMSVGKAPIVRMLFSPDGLHLAYYDTSQLLVVLKYLPKGHGWMEIGKSRSHSEEICDVQFFIDPDEVYNRLFSLGKDRYFVEYDIDKSSEETGLFITRITLLEETAIPTAFVFDGPPEYGIDCVTFANNINKLRTFSLEDEKVKHTCCSPVFGRDEGINRMIAYPVQMNEERFKTFTIYIVKNKIGIMDTPVDGNPHKYTAVFTHPRNIIEAIVLPDQERIFTLGKDDNCSFLLETSPKAVEARVLMGGSGMAPYYHTLRRHWGGACQDIIRDVDMIFFFLNVKRIEKQTDLYKMNRNIRLCEIPAVCRACGFYLSEYEVGLIMDEIRRMKQSEQTYSDDFSTECTFDEFIKLFVNHYYRLIDEDVEEAFQVLGFDEPEEDQAYMCRHDFNHYLTQEGEMISQTNMPIYFGEMYHVRKEEEEEGEGGPTRIVKCHTIRPSMMAETEASTTIAESDEDLELDTDTSGQSDSSSTSSEDLGQDEDEEEGDEEEEEENEEDAGKKEEPGDPDSDKTPTNSDEQQKKRKSSVVATRRASKVEKRKEDDEDEDEEEEGEGTSEEEEEGDEEEEEDDYELPLTITRKGRAAVVNDLSQAEPSTFDSSTPTPPKPIPVELPEKIELLFFLDTMLPPESQQTIQWTTSDDTDKDDLSLNETKRRQMDEKKFLREILKQIIDPSYPIPKKLLNALYTEFYMEHGNFSVPPEIRFPGVVLPSDNWYNEDGEEEEEEEEDGRRSSEGSGENEGEDEEEVEEEEETEEEKEKDAETETEIEENVEDQSEDTETEAEREEGPSEDEDDEEEIETVDEEEEEEEGNDTVMPPLSSFDEEDHEDENYTPPFSISDRPTTARTTDANRGEETSDIPEEMTDDDKK